MDMAGKDGDAVQTIGQVAYEAHWRGIIRALPWHELPAHAVSRWEHAAEAVAAHIIDDLSHYDRKKK